MMAKRWGLPLLLPAYALLSQGAQAAIPAATLAGDYALHFEQTAKTCGPTIAPVDVNVSLKVSDGTLRMQFPSGFLGVTMLEAAYDETADQLNHEFEQRVDLGDTAATLKLTLRASFEIQDGRPGFDYTVVFDKIADDPDWNCKVEGRGWGRQ